MNDLLLKGIEFICLLSIVILAYKTVQMLQNAKVSRSFVLKSVLQEEHTQGIENTTFLERMISFPKYKSFIEKKLEEAKSEMNFTSFLIKRFIIASILTAVMVAVYFIGHMVMFLYLALPVGIIAFQMPMNTLKKRKAYFERQLGIELPEYLSAFAVLLNSYTPFEATKKSVDYAGELIKPYVEELVTQIELYPASVQPYLDFAESINLVEAREFVMALSQIMQVDSESANQIIKDQITIMEEKQEEAYKEELENRPDEVEAYILPMIFPLIAIILTFVAVLTMDAVKDIF